MNKDLSRRRLEELNSLTIRLHEKLGVSCLFVADDKIIGCNISPKLFCDSQGRRELLRKLKKPTRKESHETNTH